MGFDRIRIKENAKIHYQVNKWNNVIVVLIGAVAAGVSGGASSSSSSSMSDLDPAVLLAVSIIVLAASAISIVISLFVTNIVLMGEAGWFQKSIHSDKLDIGVMFAPFKTKYMDNVLTMFLKQLYIFLWSLLLIIPGIVKTYAYSMVEYIKSENPNITPSRAIEMSNIMTEGHKMDLFVLELSFLGWNILSIFTFGILSIVYVGPYYNAAKAFAYEELKAEAIASGKLNAEEFTASGLY